MSRREDVAKAALDVGMLRTYVGLWEASTSELIHFYDAAFKAGVEEEREAEREACAKLADYYDDVVIAKAIRARGEKA